MQTFSKRDELRLFETALGRRPADLAVINANLLNVYTGEFLERFSVSVSGEWISYVGTDAAHTIGPETHVIDARGQTLIPGLIDGHTHMAMLVEPSAFLTYAAAGGTTTIITETMEVFPITGLEGIHDFMDSVADQPIKVFGTVPAMASISSAHGISPETAQMLLAREDMLGIGESYWQSVFQNPQRFIPLLKTATLAGKTIEGHSAGAHGPKLAAYAATGVSSCHEPIQVSEVMELLRLGMYVMIREGSIRRDLETISKIKDRGIDLRRLVLATDGLTPQDLMDRGNLEGVVQKAIDCGFKPAVAIQMATLNVAEHFGIADRLGGIAPGRWADLVIIPDPHTIEAQTVISNGAVIAQNGKLLKPPRPHRFSHATRHSIHLPRELTAADFKIKPAGDTSQVRVRVIDQITDLVTHEKVLSMSVEEDELRPDLTRDIIKVAAVDRITNPSRMFVGLIRGFQMKAGALAYSGGWDASDVIVVGADEADMARAVNRIRELQGGAVACARGEILAEIALPLFGIMSDRPLPEVVSQAEAFSTAVRRLGAPFPDPLLTLATLTGAAIPYLRICEEGLVNLKSGETLGLQID